VKVSATTNGNRKMELVNRVGTRDRGKEEYWRTVLKQFGQSQQSQSSFCKEHRLNHNTFCYWKSVIAQRDAEEARSNKGRRIRTVEEVQPDLPPAPASQQPLFTRFAIADLSPAEPGAPSRKSGQSDVAPSIAAEVVDANNGRRLRIFNGADQATVAALISALASLSGCGNGF